jgi:hypothetical protein
MPFALLGMAVVLLRVMMPVESLTGIVPKKNFLLL